MFPVQKANGTAARRLESEPLNAFTVDVEDYFHVSAFENRVSRDDWDRYASRVVPNTHRLLALLDAQNVKATFFVLGWVASRHPQLVRDIHAAGHEIACHGFWHRLIYRQTPAEFRGDLRAARDAICAPIGRPVTAFRAPSFSITRQSTWALDVLAEEGFTIDSSIFPVRHDRYGIPGAPAGIHRIVTAAADLWEFPPSVVRLAGLNVPVSGGGYFRLYPLPVTLGMLRRINRRLRRPFMFYVHPWEIDPQQPRIEGGSRVSRTRHYLNLRSTEKKLGQLLRKFRFGPLGDAIDRHSGDAHRPAVQYRVRIGNG
jgi:polysaccharide deacetylase family protein (PEP-CTERM system associated)